MKKLIAIVLVVVLSTALCVFSVSAESTTVAQGADLEKMSEDLQNTLKQMSGEDKTDVYLKIEPAIKYDGAYNALLKSRVLEKMGLTSVPTWKDDPEGHRQFEALRYSMLMEDYNKNAVALLELLAVPEEDNLTPTSVTMYWHWRLTASQICLASEQACVLEMQTTEFILDDDEEPDLEAEIQYKDNAENEQLYLDSFKKLYVDEEGMGAELLFYEELYYSKDNNGNVEWAFVHAQTNMFCPEIVDRFFHGVYVQQANIYVPFEFGYGVYDVKEDRFYDLTEVSFYNKTHDTPKYEYAFDLFKTYYKAETRYEIKFKTWSVNKFGEELLNNYGYTYNELFTHYDGENPDWVLCQAKYGDFESPMITWLRIGGIGGRTIIGTSWDMPFATGYGVYDVKANEFYALEDLTDDCFRSKDNDLSADKYEGLVDALAELNIGYMTGDANGDNKVDILDATFVQKVAGGKADIDYYQELNLDVNKDNNVDILDATAIQKYAAA